MLTELRPAEDLGPLLPFAEGVFAEGADDEVVELAARDDRLAEPHSGRSRLRSSSSVVAIRPRLFGRDADVAKLRAKLASGASVITLFGPPGIGKTALATATTQPEADEGRVVFVDLAEVHDRAGVCNAMSLALGAPVDPHHPPRGHLAVVRLPPRSMILLDACDQAVADVAELVRGWVASSPNITFVVTSRELLGLSIEHAYEVGPLAVPPPGKHESPAVDLFLARAEQCRREELSSFDPEVIADIVRSLEGIPLALELAATRIAVLSPAELRARLARRLDVLTSNLRTVHSRQRTMRAAIEGSWRLLEPHERAVLRQLRVFRGGFDTKAAEAVIDLCAHPQAPPVADLLQSLRSKSMLRGIERADNVRLGLYEVVRELGAEDLRDAGEESATMARHAAYYSTAGMAWCAAMGTPMEHSARACLIEETDNLLAVHSRALEGRTPGGLCLAFRILLQLEPIMWTSLPLPRSLALLEQTLTSAAAGGVEDAVRGEVLLQYARILELMGRDGARAAATEALSLACKEENARLQGRALLRLGRLEVAQGGAREGRGTLKRAAAILLSEEGARLAADALTELGASLRVMGEAAEARLAHKRALGIRARIGDDRGTGVDLTHLAVLELQEGRLELARGRIEHAARFAARFDDRYMRADAMHVLGRILAELGELDEAAVHLEEARDQLDELGERRLRAVVLANSAIVSQLRGRHAEARATYSEALRLLREHGDRLHEALVAGAASTLAWTLDASDEASTLWKLAQSRLTELSASVDARLAGVLSVHLGHRDVWLHRKALRAGRDRSARTSLEAARSRLNAGARTTHEHPELRLAYRLLEVAVDGYVPVHRDEHAIEVGPDALWFRTGARPRVDLRRRRAPRLVLRALVEAHERTPGTAVPVERLVAIGWPDEKVAQQSALSRLYVTVRTLRELGLRSQLLHQDNGYLIDSAVHVRRMTS